MGNSSSKSPEASHSPDENSGSLETNQNTNVIVTEELHDESLGPNDDETVDRKNPPQIEETEPVNDEDCGPMYSNVEVIGSLDEYENQRDNGLLGPKSGNDNHVFSKCSANDWSGKRPVKIQKSGNENIEGGDLDLQGLEMVDTTKSRDAEPKPDISILLVGLIGSGKSTLKKHIQLCLG